MKHFATAAIMVSLVTGCAHVGTRSVQRDMPGFNEAMAQATDEQLLNNLVRLHFRDTPTFLSVVSIAASESLSLGASANFARAGMAPQGTRRETRTGAQIGYSQMPTISYRPLQGAEFSKHLTRPITLETMMLLGISGFDFLDIWELFTERLPMGDTPRRPLSESPFPDAKDVAHFAELLLQLGRATDFEHRDPFKGVVATSRSQPESEATRRANAEVMSEIILTRFASQHGEAKQQAFRDDYLGGSTVLIYRSLLGVLNYLSHTVESGAATVPEGSNAMRYLRIRSGSRPADPYCATRYRGVWYWIDYDDERSKSTLALLSILYNAISDTHDGARPQFSIPLR